MIECVVRMEMPETCYDCPSFEDVGGYCFLRYYDFAKKDCMIDHDVVRSGRMDWCPILDVLPEKHGELIDRQAVYEKIKWWQEKTHDTVTKAMLHEFYLMLFGVPAIVPATEGGKDDI